MKSFIVYTDGSYLSGSGEVHGGIVFVPTEDGMEARRIHVLTRLSEFVSMNNVGGEVLAAWCAIYSVVNEVKKLNEQSMDTYELNLVYDYKGIGEWATRGWKRNRPATIWFEKSVTEMLESVPNLKVNYIWVKGHADTEWNEEADSVAYYTMAYAKGAGFPICDMDEVLKEVFNK